MINCPEEVDLRLAAYGRSSLRAYLLHWGRICRKYVRFFRGHLVFEIWGLLAWFLRIVGRFQSDSWHQPEAGQVVLLASENPNPAVRGPDITNGLRHWLRHRLGLTIVLETNDVQQVCSERDNQIPLLVIASYDWLLPFCRLPLVEQVRTAIYLRRNRARVWAMLPDCYWLQLTLASSILVAISGGVHPLLTNSPREVKRFGIVRPSGPHFWTLPNLPEECSRTFPWVQRAKTIIGSRSGEQRRRDSLERVKSRVQEQGYLWQWSDSANVSYRQYMDWLKRARVAAVPTFLQADYRRGPKRYQKRLSQTIITGRVWETFASGTALLTQDNRNLEDFGFNAGVHYLTLPDMADLDGWSLPPDRELMEVADAGRRHFLQISADESFPVPE